jgi:hypothetical protein
VCFSLGDGRNSTLVNQKLGYSDHSILAKNFISTVMDIDEWSRKRGKKDQQCRKDNQVCRNQKLNSTGQEDDSKQYLLLQ